MDWLLIELFRKGEDADGIERAALGANATAGAEFFVDTGFFVGFANGNTILARSVHGAELCAEVAAAFLGMAAIFDDDSDTGHM